MADYSYEIGATAGARSNIETQGINPPSGIRFEPFSTSRTRGDGLAVGAGYPRCEWYFEYLSSTMYNIFLTLLSGEESAVVSIQTRKETKAYQAYATCVMHAPDGEMHSGGWHSVTIKFTRLEI